MARPEKKFKVGACEAAIFENEIRRNGGSARVKKVNIQKRYRASDDTWKSTYSLDVNDVPKMVLALTKAYEYLTMGGEVAGNGDNEESGVEEM